MKLVSMSYVLVGLLVVGGFDSAFATDRKKSRKPVTLQTESDTPVPSKLKDIPSPVDSSNVATQLSAGDDATAGEVALAESRKNLADLPAAIVAITGEGGSVNLKELRKLGKAALEALACVLALDATLGEEAKAKLQPLADELAVATKKRTLDGAAVVKLLTDSAEDFASKTATSISNSVEKSNNADIADNTKKSGKIAALWAKMPSRASMKARIPSMPSLSRKAKYAVGGVILCGTCVAGAVYGGYVDPMAVVTAVREVTCACNCG